MQTRPLALSPNLGPEIEIGVDLDLDLTDQGGTKAKTQRLDREGVRFALASYPQGRAQKKPKSIL